MHGLVSVLILLALVTGCSDTQRSPEERALVSEDVLPADSDMSRPDVGLPDDSNDVAMADDVLEAGDLDSEAADLEANDAQSDDAQSDDAQMMDGAFADDADSVGEDEPMPSDDVPEPPRPAIVALDGTGDYLDLSSALEAAELDILVRAGVYEVDQTVVFEHPNTTVRGEAKDSVRFVQTAADKDLFVVRADGVTVSNLTLDTVTAGQAAFVEQGASGITLEDTVIHGGDRIFTLYFAGPVVAAGAETLGAYREGALSRGNRVLRNTITSRFIGDSVVFALQADGEVRDNTLSTGMMALYMVQDVACVGNTITDSPTDGIFISLPSANLTVAENVVLNPRFSGVVVKPQLEHDASGQALDSTGIVIEANTLRPRLFGVAIDGTSGDSSQGRLQVPELRGNTVELNDFAGVYLLRVEAPVLDSNTITFVGADTTRRGVGPYPFIADTLSAGVFVDLEVTSPVLTGNQISRGPDASDLRVMQNAVVLQDGTITNATIRDNVFRRHGDDWIHSPCAQDLGASDHDGVFDPARGAHLIEGNRCESELP